MVKRELAPRCIPHLSSRLTLIDAENLWLRSITETRNHAADSSEFLLLQQVGTYILRIDMYKSENKGSSFEWFKMRRISSYPSSKFVEKNSCSVCVSTSCHDKHERGNQVFRAAKYLLSIYYIILHTYSPSIIIFLLHWIKIVDINPSTTIWQLNRAFVNLLVLGITYTRILNSRRPG